MWIRIRNTDSNQSTTRILIHIYIALKVDNAEYGLLTALVIFSERFSLHEPKKVEKIQEIYVEAFEAYVYNRRSRQNVMFAKLLNTLCVVKNLANKNSEQVFSLMISDEKFPKILSEMWGQ
jgi:ecdysone receptor